MEGGVERDEARGDLFPGWSAPNQNVWKTVPHVSDTEQESADQSSGADSDPDHVIASVAGLMRELGYESSAVEGAQGPEIEARNCVFHDLAMADPKICEVDLALLRSMTGRSVDHRRCMARGERSCRFAFGPAKPNA